MSALQLSFNLRTAASCKTVHLVGNWDNYNGQLPLSKDSTKSGGWKGTFRFQTSTLKPGQRYWYYYIIDGYHVSHDPARDHVVEPTTGRKLNTLDIPAAKKPSSSSSKTSSSRHSRHLSHENIAKGRALDPSLIEHPRPVKPHETRSIRVEGFKHPTIDQLAAQFARQQVDSDDDDSDSDSDSDSDADSDVPSLSSRSSNSSTPSSVSSTASSCCTCERYGITRAGSRVKLDCGGSRCGGSSTGSECSSESEDDYRPRTTRRQGVVIRSRQ